ncbi:MAG: hypothetical protein KKG76_13215 [Euryarchaeota archaeon]|nr:hypothetical protein [Euryarchaeota archaeon]MBU4138573.1 hypothetical protein [Euryarchaeota archaeon]
MADVIRDEKGQLMLLTVFMIIIEVVSFTTILNSMIFSANLQSTGLEESKQEIRDFRLITEAEVIKAAKYATLLNSTNQTQVSEYFYKYMQSYNDTIKKIYSARGASVEVIINNMSLNETTSNLTVNKYHVEWKNHTFPEGSLVIPMDENQTTNQSRLMRVYGLIYKIVDGSGPSGKLNGTSIPVWTILQNPVNSSVTNFSSTMNTRNASTLLNSSYRNYSGGPFLIDVSKLVGGNRDLILNESNNKSIIVHELIEPFYYEQGIEMVVQPKIAIFPESDSVMEKYYADGEVPYTGLSDNQIQNGNLTNYDILTIPHEDMDTPSSRKNTIIAIEAWVANGGVLHVQCAGTHTMDNAVEKWAGSRKPWYGFIGINRSVNASNKIHLKNMTYIKLIDNVTRFNTSYSFNMSPPVSLAGLADPGTPYNPLTQSHNKSGMLGNMTRQSTTPAFSLRRNESQVNPAANILGIATNATGTPVYIDADITLDTFKDAQLMYIEAPYENGLVSYLAGHDQTMREGGERLIFDNFFAASMRRSLVTTIAAKNINVTIKYYDGKVRYTDTFIINS